MKRVLARIEERKARFASHPFFAEMEGQAPYEAVKHVVPALAFWVLSFHDLLEMAEEAMVDPELRRIVRHHRGEESGHDRWYLEDLARLGVPLPNPVALFGREHEATRRASFRLIAEVIRSERDLVRVALVLVMEATGAVFFVRSSEYRNWPADGLAFFSGHHLEVEKAHELFEQRMHRFLEAIVLDDPAHAEASAMVERGFDAFEGMFDGLPAEGQVVARSAEAHA